MVFKNVFWRTYELDLGESIEQQIGKEAGPSEAQKWEGEWHIERT